MACGYSTGSFCRRSQTGKLLIFLNSILKIQLFIRTIAAFNRIS
jgi:hypothetical protein